MKMDTNFTIFTIRMNLVFEMELYLGSVDSRGRKEGKEGGREEEAEKFSKI